jgi:DNA (cytosine-5)-methyltransferase 1
VKYLSVCSGIEAATVAWHSLGWEAEAFSEIEKFPSKVLAHHYPHVPNLGDMTKFEEWNIESIDLLVGGTPCQSFSVAGLRKGLSDPRGNLMLTFGAIANRFRPRWLVWENVPGVLSSNGGRDFGTFLGMLVELGYGWSYRVLDAQYFGVAQRRRRVFVVGYLGDFKRAAAVLFERHSLSGNPAPSRKKGEEVAGTFKACASSGGWSNSIDHAAAGYMQPVTYASQISRCIATREGSSQDWETTTMVAQPIALAENTIGSLPHNGGNGNGFTEGGPMYTPNATGVHGVVQPIGFAQNQRDEVRLMEVAGALAAEPGAKQQTYLHQAMRVRRLTPMECERLQGFPDNYTNIPNASDGPRYKALGNSMAVPVMHWIGKRIRQVEDIVNKREVT